MSNDNYKEEHVDFVVSENGTTSGDVISILISSSLLPPLSLLIIPWLTPVNFAIRNDGDVLTFKFIRFLVEFPLVAILNLLLMTLFASPDAETGYLTTSVTWCITLLCILVVTVNHTLTRPRWNNVVDQWKKLMGEPVRWDLDASGSQQADGKKYPFLTNFRGMLLFLTVLSILAVDFRIFPRRLAKTKKFGVSLMDIGTASFIFSNGIVSPEAKNRKSSLRKAVISCIPLVSLGLIRALAVKATDYHEIVEEYGVHWNFFLTLASVKLLSACTFAVFRTKYAGILGVTITVLYEILLVGTDMQDGYLLNPNIPRTLDLISANREGIFSAIGYMAVFMGSVHCGQMLYNKKDRASIQDWLQYVIQNVKAAGLLWILYNVTVWIGNPPCRRVANAGYIIWSLAVNITMLSIAAGVMVFLSMGQNLGLLHGPMTSYHLSKRHGKQEESAKPESGEIDKDKNTTANELDDLSAELEVLSSKQGYDNDEDSSAQLEKILDIESRLKKLNKSEHESANLSQKPLHQSYNQYQSLPNLVQPSFLYDAVCYNGLIVFLIANLLTGLVNNIVYTLHASYVTSFMYLSAYTFTLYFISVGLYAFGIQLKFW